ncbi:hypothetical protein C8Q77DRAFT_230729 [Trametes polyzona]|nr:hypothetical protein C8Q77DRAFT_230729 [Trametes polyzona]
MTVKISHSGPTLVDPSTSNTKGFRHTLKRPTRRCTDCHDLITPAWWPEDPCIDCYRKAATHPGAPSTSSSRLPESSTPRKRKAEEDIEFVSVHESNRRAKDTDFGGVEYQTEDALVYALAAQWKQAASDQSSGSSSSPQPLSQFCGRYTVVRDPNVDAIARVERFVRAGRFERGLPIGKLIIKPDRRHAREDADRYSRRYWCTCQGVRAPTPPPMARMQIPSVAPAPSPTGAVSATNATVHSSTPSSTPSGTAASTSRSANATTSGGANTTQVPKRSQSTLTRWFAAAPKRAEGSSWDSAGGGAHEPPGRGVCGGTVEVVAETDYSHPLARKGVKGQRVTVRVRHWGM